MSHQKNCNCETLKEYSNIAQDFFYIFVKFPHNHHKIASHSLTIDNTHLRTIQHSMFLILHSSSIDTYTAADPLI